MSSTQFGRKFGGAIVMALALGSPTLATATDAAAQWPAPYPRDRVHLCGDSPLSAMPEGYTERLNAAIMWMTGYLQSQMSTATTKAAPVSSQEAFNAIKRTWCYNSVRSTRQSQFPQPVSVPVPQPTQGPMLPQTSMQASPPQATTSPVAVPAPPDYGMPCSSSSQKSCQRPTRLPPIAEPGVEPVKVPMPPNPGPLAPVPVR